ncbi:MAG: hypothetical protein DHS80DRAFT_17488 [Piptocephalis tieghemiana]|nr:MAG: hypothetical protein DHS80DRAFT_17488 [Piptocephalis tieghemiana]
MSRRYILGLVALLGVVALWTSSSYAISFIFLDHSFNKPFFLTFLNTSTFSLYLLPYVGRWMMGRGRGEGMEGQTLLPTSTLARRKRIRGEGGGGDRSIMEGEERGGDGGSDSGSRRRSAQPEAPEALEPLTLGQTARSGLSFCILWFAANWSLNAALAYTSVGSSTIISSTSALFTLVLGVWVGVERFSTAKLLAVLASIIGVSLVTYADLSLHGATEEGAGPLSSSSSSSFSREGLQEELWLAPPAQPTIPPPLGPAIPSTMYGDILALFGAFFYGAYATLLKWDVRDERRVDPQLFLGFVGLFNLVLLWPIFFIFHYTGVETFELPSTQLIWAMLIVNALVGTFLSDYLWLLAMLMTSPLVVTLGLSLTIPLTLVGDMIRRGRIPGLGYWTGAFLVIFGFFLVNASTLKEDVGEEEEEEEEEEEGREGGEDLEDDLHRV